MRLAGRGILLISQHPYPAHRVLRRNVDFLAAQGAEVDVVCLASPGASTPPPPGVRLHRVPLAHRRAHALRYAFEYLAFFAAAFVCALVLSLRRRYDAVQVENPPDFLLFTALPARLRGARLVLYLLELTPELLAARLEVGESHVLTLLATALERAATAVADQVITVSEACRRRVEARGVPADKLWVVNGSVPTRDLPAARPALPGPYLVVVATLIKRYGVDVAIRALAALGPAGAELRLLVLGEGEERPGLEALSQELGLADRVVFAGLLPWEVAMAQVRAAAVGLVPVVADGYGELILPTKLLEYVALEVPAVCSRLPTIAEHFRPESLAYFEPGDHLGLAAQVGRLLADPDAARRQARIALEDLGELSWERASQRYLAALATASGEQPATALASEDAGIATG